MYGAVALGFGHQLAGPDLAGHRGLQVGWALAYTHAFGAGAHPPGARPAATGGPAPAAGRGRPPRGRRRRQHRVEGQHLDELAAEPGQFFRWRFLTPDHWATAHPFSLSAPPTATSLRLTVKALGDGTRSLQDVPVGTWVVSRGPVRRDDRRPPDPPARAARRGRRRHHADARAVRVAAARGRRGPRAAVPARRSQDVLFRRRARRHRRRARRPACTTSSGEDPALTSPAALLRLVPDLAARDVYLCGPPGLAAAVRASLAQAGLPPERLHEERFAL